MFVKRIIPILAVIGIIGAVVVSARTEKKAAPAQPVALPAQAPYREYIGGAGVVEASSENISVGTPIAGIVQKVYVTVGDKVKVGTPLFELDDREYQALISVRKGKLAQAIATVSEAEATLADAQSRFSLVAKVMDPRAVSMEELDQRRNALALAEAKVKSAHAAVEAAQADVRAAETDLARTVVRAPITGEILQMNIHTGELASFADNSKPLIRIGNLDRFHVRVDIDENDAWRFKPGTKAVAIIRGNRDMRVDLDFVRTEPNIVPKTSLTGSSTEKVDTRVLQVLYAFSKNRIPAYVGQQLDVFIEATTNQTVSAHQ